MKKLLFLILIIFVLVGCDKNLNINDDSNNDNDIIKEESDEIEDLYVDTNLIKISIYSKSNNEWVKAPSIYTNWEVEKVIGNLDTYLVDETNITTSNYKNTWLEYFNKYEEISNYKIGYNIKFSMQNGEIIDKLILSPKDTDNIFDKIMIYLYDDINVATGAFYSHMEENEMTEKTILSSIKLVGGRDIKEINSPIELTAFTYSSEDDFDKDTGKYRGNSYYITLINRGV